MRFQVPQFTETETKLIGPLSLRQFLWFLAAGLIVLFLQFLISGVWLLIAGGTAFAIAAACAYAIVDGLTLPMYILSALVYLLNKKKYFYEQKK